jgi:hypothetical protein
MPVRWKREGVVATVSEVATVAAVATVAVAVVAVAMAMGLLPVIESLSRMVARPTCLLKAPQSALQVSVPVVVAVVVAE